LSNLFLDLGEFEVMDEPLEVVKLRVGLLKQTFLKLLFPQQKFGPTENMMK
jgi:hypothetical protein